MLRDAHPPWELNQVVFLPDIRGILESCHQREIPRGTYHTGPKLVTSHRPSGDKGLTEASIHPPQPERSPSTMQGTRLHSTGTLRDGIREHNMGPSHQRAQQQAGEDTAQGHSLGYLAVLAPHQCNVPDGPAEMATPGRPKAYPTPSLPLQNPPSQSGSADVVY